LVIFDCNGVLVDSEPIASAVLAEALTRAGIAVSADVVARRFHGRRPVDIFAAVEAATGKKLPPAFASVVAVETLRRFRTQLRALPHVVHALTWIRGPRPSPPLRRLIASKPVSRSPALRQFFRTATVLASNVARGKPAPDVFEFAAARAQINPADCIVVEDSVSGVTAAVAAGMRAVVMSAAVRRPAGSPATSSPPVPTPQSPTCGSERHHRGSTRLVALPRLPGTGGRFWPSAWVSALPPDDPPGVKAGRSRYRPRKLSRSRGIGSSNPLRHA